MKSRMESRVRTRSAALLLTIFFCFWGVKANAVDIPSHGIHFEFLTTPHEKLGLLASLSASDDDDCDDVDVNTKGNTQLSGNRPTDLSRSKSATFPQTLATLDLSDKVKNNRPGNSPAQDQIIRQSNAPGLAPTQKIGKTAPQSKPPAVVPSTSISTPPLTPSWEIIPADKTLNVALSRWAGSAGWQLVWELSVDYAVETRTTVPGTFEEAVATVVNSMSTAEIPMKAIFYNGNKVIRIVAKGVE